MELILGLVGLAVIYFTYRTVRKVFFRQQKKKVPHATPRVTTSQTKQHSSSTTKPTSGQGQSAKWYAKDQRVRIQSYDIPGGLIYVGDALPDQGGYTNDACLINPKLSIIPPASWDKTEEMGYWPRYADISAKARGAYLHWLATGRTTPNANIGAVFLFFYGLERRLFIDGRKEGIPTRERDEIVNEVNRLLGIYGENRSFRGYAHNFLAMEWVLFRNDQPIPAYLDFTDRYAAEPFQVVLANYVAAGKPIPSDVALQWLTLHPEVGLRTPARRCTAEFQSLFRLRYQQQFGDGLLIKPNKAPLTLTYQAASPSFMGGFKVTLPDLPNPFALAGPIKKLGTLAEACTVELEPYSRFLGRKDSDPRSLAAMALLPKELLNHAQGTGTIQAQLAQLCGDGFSLTPLATIYALLGESTPPQFSKKEAENFAALVESLGFGVAPDARFHGTKPNPHEQVVIFPHGHGSKFKPSASFRTLCTALRLGAIVSQIDQELATAEETRLQALVQESHQLTAIEQQSLRAFLYWALRTPQSTAGLKQKLAEVSSTERSEISQILLAVAFADGRLDPKEVKQLEKLYVTLGLDKEQVTSDLHTLTVTSEPITVGVRDPEVSFKIPKPAKAADSSTGFRLNTALIRAIADETQQAQRVLGGIFTDTAEEEVAVVSATSGDNPTAFAKLDPAHQTFFNRLIEQPQWARTAVHELCHELNLMVDGAMEVLNEWAFAHANAPLIDDGDPIYIDIDLAREIVSA